LKARFAVNGIQKDSRSLGATAARGADAIAFLRHARACPGHPRLQGCAANKTWMAGTSPAMTTALPRQMTAATNRPT
jgi:hypothetical protein